MISGTTSPWKREFPINCTGLLLFFCWSLCETKPVSQATSLPQPARLFTFFRILTFFSSFASFAPLIDKSIEPRFITPEHDYSKRPLQLFWIDGLALKAIAADLYKPEELESDTETAMVTQVVEEDESSSNDSLLYPLQPPVSCIGNFKTTPATHMGYAATWFGLSGAGLYMTRKLITRGRY